MEAKHFPKPKYDKCNAGHTLVEVFDEKRNQYVWDCPICIAKMNLASGVSEAEKFVAPEKKEQWKKNTQDIMGQLLGGM